MTELAQIVLVRAKTAGLELFVFRRGSQGAFGLPNGAIHANEDPRVAAARVLFEDAGVLLGRDAGTSTASATLEMPSLPALRRKILGGANATEVLRAAGFTWASESLHAWAHWQAPSSSGLSSPGIRLDGGNSGTSTRLFVAQLPAGLLPAFEKTEGVESTWLLANEAEARGDELHLPPHVIRTCWELAHFDKVAEVMAAAKQRSLEPHPILPRMAPNLSLLLPWDPDYATAGQGESLPFSYHPKWALGPSRFVREDGTWKLVAPHSTPAV